MLTRALRWLWTAIQDYGWQVLTVLGVTGLSAEGVIIGVPNHRVAWLHSPPGIVFVFCVAAGLAGSIATVWQAPRLTRLKSDLARSRQAGEDIDMATVRDVIAYLCAHYPHKTDLSKARLAKMVYLADWRSAIERHKQLTDIQWEFNYYGPYVSNIVDIARADPAFEVYATVNMRGGPKEVVLVNANVDYPSLTMEDKSLLDTVIASVAPQKWDDFIHLVYSTYPIVTQPRFSKLDLVALAQEYEEYKREQALAV